MDDVTSRLVSALAPLAKIAVAYEENALDGAARKERGTHLQHKNTAPFDEIEIYTGRGGSRLLTLADCFKAKAALDFLGEKMSDTSPPLTGFEGEGE